LSTNITAGISVIIPSFNHGDHISKALESVGAQNIPGVEIIVVDDGSTDDTEAVVKQFSGVQYLQQANAGPSAARNFGLSKSTGDYIVFLDADDWLLPGALEKNLSYLLKFPDAAFVYGAHQFIKESSDEYWNVENEVTNNHYFHLLEKNFIGMLASVMFRRSILEENNFDETLRGCEDYDLYLRITRKYAVCSHKQLLAVYLLHAGNNSARYRFMLENALLVLGRQKSNLDDSELAQYNKGLVFWKNYYAYKIYHELLVQYKNGVKIHFSEIKYLEKISPGVYKTIWRKHPHLIPKWRKLFMNMSDPSRVVKAVKKRVVGLFGLNEKKSVSHKINFGDLERLHPISKEFGYDRGGPIDRYYIENFLQRMSQYIKGVVLEIGDNEYTLRYGNSKVDKSEIFHVDESNAMATYTGDLTTASQIPSNRYDCIILTQTLQLIYDYRNAIATCHRILKPGGYLLLTVPGISHVSTDQWSKNWFWAFTNSAVRKILSEHFEPGNTEVKVYGNVLVATAYLYGLGLPEIKKEYMDATDPHYQVIITGSAQKAL
jgi:glycosyltransferase involved in cell wall biosynthesis